MPVYRGPDGKIIEENTRSISAKQKAHKASQIEGKTRKLSSKPVVPLSNEAGLEESISGKTEIIKSTRKNEIQDPVVGWLVVIEGQGRGAFFALGVGANSIGRGEKERVSIRFGDKQISRESHAILTYDPKGKQFFLQGGGGISLTYLNDEVVLTPTKLKDKSIIQIGETKLRFVGFCDDEFTWEG